ncbi:MAG: membrane protein insertase YidC [Endomicrobium sp.]|jgi:YidC/Oxa1 family membrane protein insertase|nr:membrane protein insertase YidC [Endomicrobium sp.]
MQRNSILFIVLSLFTVLSWYFLIAPRYHQHLPEQAMKTQSDTAVSNSGVLEVKNVDKCIEENVSIDTEKYKAVLTNKGAAIMSWSIKEKNGQVIDLVFPESAPVMANFPDEIYKIVSKSNKKVVFEYISVDGWKITKTYSFSDFYMHNLSISIEKTPETYFHEIVFKWGPGLGADANEMKENILLTKISASTAAIPKKIEKFKNVSKSAALYKWVAVDNKYFLAAFMPTNFADFDKIISSRIDKKHPYSLTFTAIVPKDINKKDYSINFYLGPKIYRYLKAYNLGLEKTVDFGFFGFLGKAAFSVLAFFHKLTNNYGWAIIMLTAFIQVLVLPLTLKSLKSAAAMKNIQPIVKDIQLKYKDNPQRLQAEMLNVYRSQKVNPLGGCLPMLLQLPIFWAFFTMLRNVYELRNEGWVLWIKDLSAADQFMRIGSFNFNLLPLIMGVGMFFQQRMTTATSDSTQKKMMYIMPTVFTFMFWSFPSGLVIYWLTSSVISTIEQYFIMKKSAIRIRAKRIY